MIKFKVNAGLVYIMPNFANNTKLVIINRCGSIQEKIDESIKWNGKYQNKP